MDSSESERLEGAPVFGFISAGSAVMGAFIAPFADRLVLIMTTAALFAIAVVFFVLAAVEVDPDG